MQRAMIPTIIVDLIDYKVNGVYNPDIDQLVYDLFALFTTNKLEIILNVNQLIKFYVSYKSTT